MTAALVSTSRRPYGALELKQSYQQGLLWALLIAVLMHLAAFQGSRMYQRWTLESQPVPPALERLMPLRVFDLEQRYRIKQEPPPPIAASKVKEDFRIGKIVPAKPEEVVDERLLATQLEILEHLTGQSGPDGHADTTGQIGLPQIRGVDLTLPDPDSFQWVSREPSLVPNQPKPDYPELAKLAGLEGTMILRILVSSEGEVLKVLVIKPLGHDAGFEEAAIDVAWKWRFIPALQNDRPVAAWINVPVKFSLH